MEPGRAARHSARKRRADSSGECSLKFAQQRPKCQLAGAKRSHDARLLLGADHRPGERKPIFGGLAHEAGAVVPRPARRSTRNIPYSSESTSASQEDSMMFSDTPIVPHTSSPSEVSSSTRVTAPVHFVSSRFL